MTIEPMSSPTRQIVTSFGDGPGSAFEGVTAMPMVTRQPAYSTVAIGGTVETGLGCNITVPALPAISSGPVIDSWEYTPDGGDPVTVDMSYQNADEI